MGKLINDDTLYNHFNSAADKLDQITTALNEGKGTAGKLLHDAHIAILMREHGIRRIYTRDTDFFRFPFVEPVDPIRPAAPPGTAEPIARYRGSKRRR